MGLLSQIGNIFQSVIPGVGSAIQSQVNANTARYNTDATNAANMNLAKYQYSQELDMWNKANAYNTPEQQMQRFKDAGLNPNLIYGQGTPGNSPNQLPQYHAPTMRYNYQPSIDLPSMLSTYQDFRVKSAQIDNLRALADTNQQKALLMHMMVKGYSPMDNITVSEDESGQPVMNIVHKRSKYEADTELARTQAEVLSGQATEKIRGVSLANQLTGANIANVGQGVELRKTQTALNQKYLDWFLANTIGNLVAKAAGSMAHLGY